MILKASQRAGGAQLAQHLLNDRDNDHVELHELRGFVSADLAGAFREAYAVSLGTRCQQFLFSLSLNPPQNESVPIEAFKAAIAGIEARLGLTGQPRAIVFHEKEGRRHAHCVWSRIDAGTMTALNLPHFKMKLMDMSRELFREHGWEMPRGLEQGGKRDPLGYEQAQNQQAGRIKEDPKALKALFLKCWERSDSRAAFVQALLEQGFILARGDRRGFVALDRHGEIHSLSRWLGVKAKTLRERFGDGNDLPSVQDAQTLLDARLTQDIRQQAARDDAEYECRIRAFQEKRGELVSRHRRERRELHAAQHERATGLARNLQRRLPTGWKALWARASGQYGRLLQNNAAETRRLQDESRAERQRLIERQLKERRVLGLELRQLRLHREIAGNALQIEIGKALRGPEIGGGKLRVLPKIDPRQPLVLAETDDAASADDLRRRPERIVDTLSRTREFFSRNDIVRALARHIEDPLELRLAVDQALKSPSLVELELEGNRCFTTADFQKAKATLQHEVSALDRKTAHQVSRHAVDASIALQNRVLRESVGAALNEEQQEAIRHVTGPQQIAAVIGLAGAGKSTLLAAARTAWERSGYKVVGAALSGKAAAGLEKSSGIASRTLASWECSWEQGYAPLKSGDVLVIDEAGMIGTRQLLRFAEKARKIGFKLVLVGDPEQLQPIQAGTPFRDITDQLPSARLTQIRRQKEDWQQTASGQLARQETAEAVRTYRDRGFVTVTADRSAAVAALVEDYMTDLELHGAQTSRLALAHRRKDVHLINQTVRTARQTAGELAGEKLFQTDHGPRAFASGDRILFTRNDRDLGLHNGMLGTVEQVGDAEMAVLLDGEPGEMPRRVIVSPDPYTALDHGYATTIHKAQGVTVDRVFFLGSERLDGHMAYVGLTRHREAVRLYADDVAFRKLTRDEARLPERVHPSRDHARRPDRRR